jgi:hypothetical protein
MSRLDFHLAVTLHKYRTTEVTDGFNWQIDPTPGSLSVGRVAAVAGIAVLEAAAAVDVSAVLVAFHAVLPPPARAGAGIEDVAHTVRPGNLLHVNCCSSSKKAAVAIS